MGVDQQRSSDDKPDNDLNRATLKKRNLKSGDELAHRKVKNLWPK